MALDFPNSPTIGQEFTGGSFTWVWNGTSWDKVAASGSGGGGNGFFLYLGTSGNTNFTLVSPQPAGAYYITTEKSDTTYDIYAINGAGDLVGYTTNGRLIATDEIAKVTVIGGTSDDVLKFESKSTTFTVAKGDINDGAPVFATSLTPSLLESFDDTTTITGGNFATDVTVTFTGTDSVARPAKNIVRTSSTQLVVTRPDDMPPTHNPYTVTVLNPGIPLPTQAPTQHILTNAINSGTFPAWVTTSPLWWEQGETTGLTLVAGDTEASDIDYTIIAGSLIPGLTLNNETGVILGDDSAFVTGQTCNFTVRATDTAGNTSDRNFDIYVNSFPVYSFMFDPFVNAGQLETTLLFDMNL